MLVRFTIEGGEVLEKDFPESKPSAPGELAWLMPAPPEWLANPSMTYSDGEDALEFDVVTGDVAAEHEDEARAALGL